MAEKHQETLQMDLLNRQLGRPLGIRGIDTCIGLLETEAEKPANTPTMGRGRETMDGMVEHAANSMALT